MLSPNIISNVTIFGPETIGRGPSFRISYRIVIDILMAVEICAVIGAAILAHIAYITVFLDGQESLRPCLIAGLAGGAIIHYALRSWGLYSVASMRDWRRCFGQIVTAIGLCFLSLIAIAFLLKISSSYSRGWLLTWFILLVFLLPLVRLSATRVLRWLESTGYAGRRIALVAHREPARDIVEHLRRTPGICLVGIFEDSLTSPQSGAQANISDLIRIGQNHEIDEVIVDLSHISRTCMDRLCEALDVLPINVWLSASYIRRPVLRTAQLGSCNLLQIKPKPISEWAALAKTVADYIISFIALVLLAPVMLGIAVAIKLDSPGAVLFCQRRHGYNHRVINVIKFRTMHVTEDGERIAQARRNDSRVTRVGKFLRRTSLDELPQLFNVLKGEMSLVGPRPHAVAHNLLYSEKLERYANRHCVKPGITGWAQINGCRGSTEDLEQMRKRIELDLYYIENWSPFLDLRILALTPFLGFVNRNAY